MGVSELIFVGPLGREKHCMEGPSVRNAFFLKELENHFRFIDVYDTWDWKSAPLMLVRLLCQILFSKRKKFVISVSGKSAYHLICLFSKFGRRHLVYYFAVGGSFYKKIKDGQFEKKRYECLKSIVVQGNSIKRELEEMGLKQVYYCPNFKKINHIPPLKDEKNSVCRFVFCSRILPEKGCDLIFSAVAMLNQMGNKQFVVDFFGPIKETYKSIFQDKINEYENVTYKGVLDFSDPANYDLLSLYDVMLFPTYWEGEGFPGIVVDACVAGLPIIASDWSMNREVVEDGVTGWIIPSKNVEALANVMLKVMDDSYDLLSMRHNCQRKASKFSSENVLSTSFLQKIGLLERLS